MAHTTTRFRRRRGAGNGVRFWFALALALGAGTAAWTVLTRDVDWPTRNRDARAQGRTAENNGNYPLARARYETALANHPYDWETHLRLANLLNHRLNDQDDALRHYLYALAYSPDPAIVAETEAKIRILRLLRTGELEDPQNALEDMFVAAETDTENLFFRRLEAGLRPGRESYWNGWRERGRGVVAYSRVEAGREGMYDAVLELEFPDGTTMSLRLRCPLRDIWRLSLSFP